MKYRVEIVHDMHWIRYSSWMRYSDSTSILKSYEENFQIVKVKECSYDSVCSLNIVGLAGHMDLLYHMRGVSTFM